jgi:hypothetical protein
MFKLCVVPQVALFMLELIQIKENGINYFSSGWNMVDMF